MLPTGRKPTIPGEILKEEFLIPLGMTQQELADAIGISRVRVNNIINGKRSITPEFWISLQTSVDLWMARKEYRRQYGKIQPVIVSP